MIIKTIASVVTAILVSVVSISECEASDADSQQTNPEVQRADDARRSDVESSDGQAFEECPDAYRRYKEMERAAGRPQVWQGCDGAYEITEKAQPGGAAPEGGKSYQLFTERNDRNGWAAGLGAVWAPKGPWFYGLNLELLGSDDITYQGRKETLLSLYGFGGIAMDTPISPYVELGIDIGDVFGALLLEKVSGECDPSQRDDCVVADYYAAIGIQTRATPNVPRIRVYAKSYMVNQEGRSAYVPVAGISLGWAF